MLVALLISARIISSLSLPSDDGFDLVFVQALWRHGDRAAQYPYKNDQFVEEDWKIIGSGIGQLTYKGVKQQIQLGEAIRQRYIESGFLSQGFDPEMIKFRSTNRNRTILSAEANFLGMYPNEGAVTLPVTVPDDYSKDCVNNVMCKCQRRSKLQNMAKNLEEYKNIVEHPKVNSLFSKLSEHTGEVINADNFWRIPDTLRCEKQNFPCEFEKKTPWYSEGLLDELEVLNTKINRFTSGLYTSKSENGVDVGKEIQKLRSGPLVSEIFERMKNKLDCQVGGGRASRLGCSETVQKMKYYAYSSHDMTLYALLNALGIEDLTSSEIGGWPSYASSLFIELLLRQSDRTPYFRVIYRNPSSSNEFLNITPLIPNCHGSSFCLLEAFEEIYNKFKIDLPISEYCHVTDDLS
ncbi:Lysosomal acid phosphatase [Caenorhabditis elegans]|uniref:Lysosomal acid phosphatase n=1 Tax=Caenorhabditis elegans TaxID=6239 RepID=E7EM29_CAEEL|nr:Lysosomal acid phosphatase [Caenorhabditis elegans]CCD63073.1 Lysosomal acid phosphatase [Caenorhabditis elegans]|eukprot:NP_494934.3 intestinal acid PHOsphatase [Caenorhabditis elegans]